MTLRSNANASVVNDFFYSKLSFKAIPLSVNGKTLNKPSTTIISNILDLSAPYKKLRMFNFVNYCHFMKL